MSYTETSASGGLYDQDYYTSTKMSESSGFRRKLRKVRKELKKKVVSLSFEVHSLKQKRSELRKSIHKNKLNRVSRGEMIKFEREVIAMRSEYQRLELSRKLDKYFDLCHKNARLKYACEDLEKAIQEEQNRRDILASEDDQIARLFDFSDLSMRIPRLFSPETAQLSLDPYKRRLEQIRSDIFACDSGQLTKSTESTAALELIRASQAEIKLRQKSKAIAEMSIETMQSILDELSMDLQRAESEKEIILRQKSGSDSISSHVWIEREKELNLMQEAFDADVKTMDERIEKLKRAVDKSAGFFDGISNEIEDLNNEYTSSLSVIHYTSDEEASDVDEIEEDDLELENMFKNKRNELAREVERLRAEYEAEKERARIAEKRKCDDIEELHDRLRENNEFIRTLNEVYCSEVASDFY